MSLLSHEHLFPPLRCSAARQGTKGLTDIKTAGVLRYSHLQLGNIAEGLYQTATFEGQDIQLKKPEAGTVPDRFKAAVAMRTPDYPDHALGKRQKNGGILLSEDASWTVLLPCELYS